MLLLLLLLLPHCCLCPVAHRPHDKDHLTAIAACTHGNDATHVPTGG